MVDRTMGYKTENFDIGDIVKLEYNSASRGPIHSYYRILEKRTHEEWGTELHEYEYEYIEGFFNDKAPHEHWAQLRLANTSELVILQLTGRI
jgi:hypothetical protein